MGVEHLPEVKIARRLIAKHALNVPYNLEALVKEYAEVLYKQFPIEGVDGICLHLKTPGKRPKVVVNSDLPRTRQRFTLAHELGHIIIPWHCGNIVDQLDDNGNTNNRYQQFEREANRFASELLVPIDWIVAQYKNNPDITHLRRQMCMVCGISEQAAEIRLSTALFEIQSHLLPPDLILRFYSEYGGDLSKVQQNAMGVSGLSAVIVADHMVRMLPDRIAYCIESNGIVMACGGSKNAIVVSQWEGDEFDPSPYPLYRKEYLYSVMGINSHWWALEGSLVNATDDRDWKQILMKIAEEISGTEGSMAFYKTVNSKLAGFHGNWKRKHPNSKLVDFIPEAIQRFNNPDFKKFIEHKDFSAFIHKRCEKFFS